VTDFININHTQPSQGRMATDVELAGVGYDGPTDPGSILMVYQRTTTVVV
jgi:hypothetical protein